MTMLKYLSLSAGIHLPWSSCTQKKVWVASIPVASYHIISMAGNHTWLTEACPITKPPREGPNTALARQRSDVSLIDQGILRIHT